MRVVAQQKARWGNMQIINKITSLVVLTQQDRFIKAEQPPHNFWKKERFGFKF